MHLCRLEKNIIKFKQKKIHKNNIFSIDCENNVREEEKKFLFQTDSRKKVGKSKVNKKNIIYRISSLCAEREKKPKNGLEISSF